MVTGAQARLAARRRCSTCRGSVSGTAAAEEGTSLGHLQSDGPRKVPQGGRHWSDRRFNSDSWCGDWSVLGHGRRRPPRLSMADPRVPSAPLQRTELRHLADTHGSPWPTAAWEPLAHRRSFPSLQLGTVATRRCRHRLTPTAQPLGGKWRATPPVPASHVVNTAAAEAHGVATASPLAPTAATHRYRARPSSPPPSPATSRLPRVTAF